MAAIGAEEVRVALPLRQDDHHERSADADRFAGREARRRSHLPLGRGARLSLDLDDEVEVLAIIEELLRTGAASASVTTEDLGERILEGQVRLEQELLHLAATQRAEDESHPLHTLHVHTNGSDAPEGDVHEIAIEAPNAGRRLAELDVDAARDVLRCAA